MGRYIYDDGEFVYKYAFGEQSSELCMLDKTYNIGAHYEKRCREEDELDYAYDTPVYDLNAAEIPKLRKLLEHLYQGHTKEEMHKIGVDAIMEFVSKQSPEWQKAWNSVDNRTKVGLVDEIRDSKSTEDWSCWGGGHSGHSFDPHKIYVKAIKEKTKLLEDMNFIAMVEAILNHIGDDIRDYTFDDEY